MELDEAGATAGSDDHRGTDTDAQSAGDAVRPRLRDSLLDAAAELVVAHGYRRMRMQDVADAAGVSRQTVYNEFGDKWGLAQALIIRDNESYLDGVDEALRRHDDLHSAVAAAAYFTLERARHDPLSRAVITGTANAELLPLLTTQAEPVLFEARSRIVRHALARWPHLDPEALTEIVDAGVRLTLSHTTLPAEPPEQVAQMIARLLTRYLGEPHPGAGTGSEPGREPLPIS